MIPLLINLLDLVVLIEVIIEDDVVHILFLAPCHEVLKHQLDSWQVKLACSAEAQKVVIIVFIKAGYIVGSDPVFKLS